jgi:hypothetical protein
MGMSLVRVTAKDSADRICPCFSAFSVLAV